MTKSITFIGCGNMAQAMICGITAAKEKYQITVIENDKKKKVRASSRCEFWRSRELHIFHVDPIRETNVKQIINGPNRAQENGPSIAHQMNGPNRVQQMNGPK